MGGDQGHENGGEGQRSPVLEALARKCAHLSTEQGIAYDRTPPEFWMLLDPEIYGAYRLAIQSGPHVQLALDTPFECYRMFSGDYQAIWSPDFGAVECEVAPCESHRDWEDISSRQKDRFARKVLSNLEVRTDTAGKMWDLADPEEFEDTAAFNEEMHARFLAYREAVKKDLNDTELDPASNITLDAGDGATVTVGVCSAVWTIWHSERDRVEEENDQTVVRRYLTLRVEGVQVTDEAVAAEILERLGNAALFELDRATGIGLTLCRQRRFPSLTRRSSATDSPLPLRLTSEYDKEPLALYWYARTASEMPLLAFLGFYQVLEFYFPQYSRRGALQTLRESLRGLTLDALRDADLARVLDAVKIGRRGAIGSELDQLKATLKHCVNQEALRAFVEEDNERTRFYTSDKCARVSRTRIPVKGSSDNWRGDVARRVYEIRNRVVHAKSEHQDLDVLLPTDPEADLLWHDVELVAFLAREVLQASGKPLQNTAVGPMSLKLSHLEGDF